MRTHNLFGLWFFFILGRFLGEGVECGGYAVIFISTIIEILTFSVKKEIMFVQLAFIPSSQDLREADQNTTTLQRDGKMK